MMHNIKQYGKWEEARFGSEEVADSVWESCVQESNWVKAELQGTVSIYGLLFFLSL